MLSLAYGVLWQKLLDRFLFFAVSLLDRVAGYYVFWEFLVRAVVIDLESCCLLFTIKNYFFVHRKEDIGY
jgi:hypothetical protein